MAAYYNEIDPFAAQWLRELIKAGHIAPGEVDERSIDDVRPDELAGYTQCHFFAGIGVWSYALRKAGWPDDRPVWTGSCPCQPFSDAGAGKGFADERHLWPAWFHLIEQREPPVVFGEQVASNDGLAWLDLVQDDLEGAGYAAGAFDLCAAGVGAPHIRQRLYFAAESRVGNAERKGLQGHPGDGDSTPGRKEQAGPTAKAGGNRNAGPTNGFWRDSDWLRCADDRWRAVQPGTFPMAHGIAARVGRVRAYGNAINAEVARTFIRAYMESAA